jgi:hypothetical protein
VEAKYSNNAMTKKIPYLLSSKPHNTYTNNTTLKKIPVLFLSKQKLIDYINSIKNSSK